MTKRVRTTFVGIIGALLLQMVLPRLNAQSDDIVETLQRVSARSSAVVSGQFTYKSLFGDRNGDPNDLLRAAKQFSFSGTSWIDRPLDRKAPFNFAKGVVDGKLMSFFGVRQPDGSINYTLQIKDGASHVGEYGGFGFRPPVFAGTFWHEETSQYVEQNKSRAVDRGVKDINGVQSRLIGLRIPSDQIFDAVPAVPPFAVGEETELWMYVAPQYGYTLPRYEFRTDSGTVFLRFESRDFREFDGVFIPSFSRYDTFLDPSNEAIGNLYQYTITDVQNVNEPLPENAFAFDIPAGTRVDDIRGGKSNFYGKLSNAAASDSIDEVLAVEKGEITSSRWKRWQVLLIIGNVCFIGCVFAAYLLVRSRRRKADQGE